MLRHSAAKSHLRSNSGFPDKRLQNNRSENNFVISVEQHVMRDAHSLVSPSKVAAAQEPDSPA
ncbi:hypothetical protein SAMN04488518_103126 [Pseudovibrio ascidiaceicola]|uniref:Transposase n=1 Tax=Pseudovibrio ascidiaceicola TaxID=285279 RepID=A0A1I3XSK5_9HYPH|nr:hypothetical protein SAMN04488518_103126 [Pseudovibrio ascidiaceicola]